MQMPARAYELMPLAVLIGGLISLSQLASGSELTVIKASGMSTKKLLLILSQFGLIFAIATVALGEWVAPTLSQKAENIKAAAINGKNQYRQYRPLAERKKQHYQRARNVARPYAFGHQNLGAQR